MGSVLVGMVPEGGEVFLEGGPGGGVFFGGEGEVEVGVVGEDIALDAGGDGGGGGEGEAVEEGGVGVVGEAVAGRGGRGCRCRDRGWGGGGGGRLDWRGMAWEEPGLAGRATVGAGSEWVSAAAATAAVELVVGGGVKRWRERLSSSVERMTEWM
jgi:hypothetical protein